MRYTDKGEYHDPEYNNLESEENVIEDDNQQIVESDSNDIVTKQDRIDLEIFHSQLRKELKQKPELRNNIKAIEDKIEDYMFTEEFQFYNKTSDDYLDRMKKDLQNAALEYNNFCKKYNYKIKV